MNKIAVVLPNWIGDVVMATPTLRAVRQQFAGAEILGVMRPYVSDVMAGTTWLDREIHYAPGGKGETHNTWSLAKALRRERPDMMLLLTNSLRTGIIAWLSGASRRVGFAHYGRGPLLTEKLKLPVKNGKFLPNSAMDSYLRLAELIGCQTIESRTELATTPADEQAADEVWQQLGLPSGDRVVVLNSGGAYGASKSWPAEYFAELAKRLAEQHDFGVLVLCGPAEREMAVSIVEQASHPRVHSLADVPLSIGLSKACVRRSRMMVSTDSGPRHFAAAFDVPVVAIYGPTDIAWSDTHFSRGTNLQLDMDCGPCMKRVCPLGHHRCMRDLTVDQVYAAVNERLSQDAAHRAA